MSDTIELTIDGQTIHTKRGSTILAAAQQAGIEISLLCYSEHTTANGLCRLCVVEVEGGRGLLAACVAEASEGAVLCTRSSAVDRTRRTILEMLASSVDLSESPELQHMLNEYDAHPERFAGGEKRQPELIDDNPFFTRDYAKCVMCWRCVQVCAEDAQYTYAINFSGRGFHSSIATFFEQAMTDSTCVYCGQCVGTCPTGALKSKREGLFEQGIAPQDVIAMTRMQGRGKRRKTP